MANLILNGSTSGSVTLSSPAVSGTTTLTLPTSSGTITVAGVNSNIVAGTSVASTSGTSIDFTSIPSWVKRVTVMLHGMSTNGTSIPQIQLGAGSIQATGYEAEAAGFQGAALIVSSVYTTGFPLGGDNAAAYLFSGNITFCSFGSNIWIGSMSGGANNGGTGRTFHGGGRVTLSGTLDRVRITTTNGTDTFDAGSVNILYE
jgi:hypothetical protein